GASLEENLAMIEDTVSYLKKQDRRVIYDAEHFFDGYKQNPGYAIRTIKAAIEGGADMVVLCDTNGGTLPHGVRAVMKKVIPQLTVPVGIHAHDDCGLGLANALAAVRAGATMVQGTINGYGERCGNTDLISVMGNLQLKMGYACIQRGKLKRLTELSRYVSEVANVPT
ncbi:MAG: citramalate synthase, partial [Deltaproteobacteria bacterium]